jgi:hypothetical protein
MLSVTKVGTPLSAVKRPSNVVPITTMKMPDVHAAAPQREGAAPFPCACRGGWPKNAL